MLSSMILVYFLWVWVPYIVGERGGGYENKGTPCNKGPKKAPLFSETPISGSRV